MLPQEVITILSNAGSAGIVGLMFLAYLYFDSKKRNKDPMNGVGKAIFEELQKQNTNHLGHIQKGISDGFNDLKNSMHEDNMKIIEVLGEIKGNLTARK